MRLISYDIGIKNLAYCIFELSNDKKISIIDWNIISLLENNETQQHQCSQMIAGKTKKLPSCKCTKIAKYQKNDQYFCEKHAKKGNYIIPTKKHTKIHLKKLKVGELEQLGRSLFLFVNEPDKKGFMKKEEMVDKIAAFYEKQCFQPIVQKKSENCGDADLIVIGKRMKKLLDENPITKTITHVIIENQISPIATRMKTIQGMLTQYYIDHIENVSIEFASSVNKLKQFLVLKNTIKLSDSKEPNKEDKKNASEKYKEHKKSGIQYCSQILQNNDTMFHEWKDRMETKKKDDLADCFLQGLWYMKHKNIISYADDLKINIV